MIEEKYLGLINREIDHMISPRQSKKLRKYLKHKPDAQRYYDDLLVISKEFSQVKIVEPPQNLKKNIINALPVGKYTKYERQNVFQRYFETLLFGNKPRYAYVFSAGLITGIIVILLVLGVLSKNNSIDFTNLYGTMGVNSSTPIFHPVENLDLDGVNLQGNIELSCSDNSVLINLSLKTSKDVNVVIEFNENEMNILEFKKSHNLGDKLKVDKYSLQFTSIGENDYQIILGCKTATLSPFSLKIDSSGIMLFEHSFLSSMNNENKY